MGWERRGNGLYYYQKRRSGRRVVSQYVGNGPAAQFVSMLDEQERDQRRGDCEDWRMQRSAALSLDEHIDTFHSMVRAALIADLMLSGFHPHKGQWRKRRHGE